MTAGRRSSLALAALLLATATATAAAQDPKPLPEPRPRLPLDTMRPRTPADTSRPRTPIDTIGRPRPRGETPAASPGTDPALAGRYRVTLNGVTVHRQTYDNPLQLDGKGDEVYFATWVAAIDTASAGLAEHHILRSRDHGDVNGFPHRVRAGSASPAGGIRTADRLLSPMMQKGGAGPSADALPMLLWEGTLEQGRSAVVLAPTVWERDGNPELFGFWMISRGATLERILRPEFLLSMLQNRTHLPQEFGSPGFVVHTNTVADARDRPIGLDRGRPAPDASFVEASAKPAGSPPDAKPGNVFSFGIGGGGLLNAIASAVQKILTYVGPVLDRGADILRFMWPQFDQAVELARRAGDFLSGNLAERSTRTDLKMALPTEAAALAKSRLAAAVDTLSAGHTKPVRVPSVPQLVTKQRPATRDFRGGEFYFFEQIIVLTPAAIADLHRGRVTASRPLGAIDVTYLDQLQLGGRYTLHLQVERLP